MTVNPKRWLTNLFRNDVVHVENDVFDVGHDVFDAENAVFDVENIVFDIEKDAQMFCSNFAVF